MVKAEMLQLVKDNLKLQTEDYDLAIMDLIQDCLFLLQSGGAPECIGTICKKENQKND